MLQMNATKKDSNVHELTRCQQCTYSTHRALWCHSHSAMTWPEQTLSTTWDISKFGCFMSVMCVKLWVSANENLLFVCVIGRQKRVVTGYFTCQSRLYSQAETPIKSLFKNLFANCSTSKKTFEKIKNKTSLEASLSRRKQS